MSLPEDAADALVSWYRERARDLPWRSTDDPYAILVSEVMLQQTRVEVVRGRWASFMDRFPDLPTLAAADRQEVLAEWSGLGYYRRARALHELARVVVDEHDAELPTDLDGLRALPGIGEYTAAAVGSIAFGIPALAIDGNVERVLARLLGIEEDPRRAAARRSMRAAGAPWLERQPPGELNQALMELGATVCTPRSPGCPLCPLAAPCSARAEGIQERIPPPRRRTVEEVEEVAAVIEKDGRLLLFRGQRPGVLAGMWEFPTRDSRLDAPEDAESPAELLAHHLAEVGVEARIGRQLGVVRHGITSRRISCRVFRAEPLQAPDPDLERWDWLTPEEARELPLAASARKILDRFLSPGTSPSRTT